MLPHPRAQPPQELVLGWDGSCGEEGRPPAVSLCPVLPQARLRARGSMLGSVQVGLGVPHWRDMCSQAPMELERWHRIQPAVPAP